MTEKQATEDTMTYTDLTNSAMTTTGSDNPSLNLATTTTNPTIDILETSQSTGMLENIPAPVLAELDITNLTLYQINKEVEEQQQYHVDLFKNSSSNMSWDDDAFSSSVINQPVISIDHNEDDTDGSDEDEMAIGSQRRCYISHSKHTIHLWQFLKNLLQSSELYGSYIKWLDRKKGESSSIIHPLFLSRHDMVLLVHFLKNI